MQQRGVLKQLQAMWGYVFLIGFLTMPVFTFGLPFASPESTLVEVILPPPQDLDIRGLFHDFYTKQMQASVVVSSSTSNEDFSYVNETNAEDFGEKFTHAVVKTAVAIGDTGLETAQHILKTFGSEIVEALKPTQRDIPS